MRPRLDVQGPTAFPAWNVTAQTVALPQCTCPVWQAIVVLSGALYRCSTDAEPRKMSKIFMRVTPDVPTIRPVVQQRTSMDTSFRRLFRPFLKNDCPALRMSVLLWLSRVRATSSRSRRAQRQEPGAKGQEPFLGPIDTPHDGAWPHQLYARKEGEENATVSEASEPFENARNSVSAPNEKSKVLLRQASRTTGTKPQSFKRIKQQGAHRNCED